MATAFFMPSSGFAAVSPTPTDWDHINTVSRPLHRSPTGTPRVQLDYSPDAVDHHVDADSMCCQFVSDVEPATKIPPQHIYLGVHARVLFNAGVDNLRLSSKLYAVSTDGTTVLATLLPLARELTGGLFSSSARGASHVQLLSAEVDLSASSWRLVLEVGAGGLGPGSGGHHNIGITFGDPVYANEQKFVRNDDALAPVALGFLLFTNGLGSLTVPAGGTKGWGN